MMVEHTPISCGVRYLYNLENDPRNLIRSVIGALFTDPHFSQLVFSDNNGYKNGFSLAEYIAKTPVLGTVVESPVVKNRNSGSNIQTWIWTLPPGAFRTIVSRMKKAISWTPQDTIEIRKMRITDDSYDW